MKQPEKAIIMALVLAVALATVFAALYGITSQRRNAARAKIEIPEATAVYDALGAAAADTKVPNEAEGVPVEPAVDLARMRARVSAFAELLQKVSYTHSEFDWDELTRWLGKPESEWPEGFRARLRQVVESAQPLLAEIRAMAAQGGPVYPLAFSEGIRIQLPHLLPMRNLAWLLKADALVAAEQGNTDRVVDNIVAMMQLGRALSDEPLVTSQLVRMQISEVAYETLRVLPQEALYAGQVDRLVVQLGQADHRNAFAAAFAGQAAIAEAFFEDPMRILDSDEDQPRDAVDHMIASGVMHLYTSIGSPVMMSDEATVLETLDRAHEAAAMPFHQSQPVMETLENAMADRSWVHSISRWLVPMLTEGNAEQARHEAMLDLAQLGLAAEAFRAEHGAYPQSLDELSDRIPGGVPVDPHTGQPYIYRPTGNAFLLYSVGMNLTDDGGRHRVREGDIVWRGVQDLTP